MDSEDPSLREIFVAAKTKEQDLLDMDTRSSSYQENLSSAIEAFQECHQLIAKIGLFNLNEESEDIATSDLQYLAVDFLLAELLLKTYGSERRETLQQALELYDSFLKRLDAYDILSRENKKLFERFAGNKSSFTLISSQSAEEQRRNKIARLQHEKAVKAKLELLRKQSNSIQTDDEVLRQLYLTQIEAYANQAFQSLDMITQENEILAHARLVDPSPQPHSSDYRRQPSGQDSTAYSERLDSPLAQTPRGGPLLSATGKPLQAFTLTDKRTQLRQGVFRSGHNLPTMSIDEYLEEEKRRGGIIDSNSNQARNSSTAKIDEDNMEQADAETMKAREWDEFVEANPKGSGNILNRG